MRPSDETPVRGFLPAESDCGGIPEKRAGIGREGHGGPGNGRTHILPNAGQRSPGGVKGPATPDVPVAAGAASRAPAPLESGFTHPGGPAGARSQSDLEDDVWLWKLAGASDAVRWQYAKEWREDGISIRRIAVRTGIPYRVMRDFLEPRAENAADPFLTALRATGRSYEDVLGFKRRRAVRPASHTGALA